MSIGGVVFTDTLVPALTLSGFDREATRNPQLHIVPSVSVHAKKTADRQIDNETNDRNKMKDYKREISLHAFS